MPEMWGASIGGLRIAEDGGHTQYVERKESTNQVIPWRNIVI